MTDTSPVRTPAHMLSPVSLSKKPYEFLVWFPRVTGSTSHPNQATTGKMERKSLHGFET